MTRASGLGRQASHNPSLVSQAGRSQVRRLRHRLSPSKIIPQVPVLLAASIAVQLVGVKQIWKISLS